MAEKKTETQTISFMSATAGATSWTWLKVLFRHKVQRKYIGRAIGSTFVTLFGLPFHLLEYLIYSFRLRKVRKPAAPIFILGHWRSGTTLLQNTLTRDPQWGRFTHYQAFFPEGMAFHPIAKPFVRALMPDKRIVDDIKVAVNAPMEEEFGLANTTAHSYLQGWYFPDTMLFHLERDLLFQGKAGNKAKKAWKKAYLRLVRKAILYWQKDRLVLKNPANTGRIRTLLELFPNAKFITIHRDPLTVFLSTMRLYRKTFPEIAFQDISEAKLQDQCIKVYQGVMQEYLNTRELIPEGNLHEVHYENFEKDKIGGMQRIYQALSLPGWETAEPIFKEYIESLKGYKKNVHEVDPATTELIRKEFAFAYEALGYPLSEEE